MKLDRSEYLESRSLKPRKLLLAAVSVNILLGLIVWLFPKEGILIGDTTRLKFVSITELTGEDETAYKVVNIDSVLAGVSPTERRDTSKPNFVNRSSSTIAVRDTQRETLQKEETEQREVVAVKEVPSYRSIYIPQNNPDALKSLINGLKNESKSKVIRILHYGDSQLEGDRISDYFRNKLQELYGGEGPGIVLPNEPAASSRRAANVSHSKNIKKHAFYVKGAHRDDGKYGVGGSSFTFSGGYNTFMKWKTDSSGNTQNAVYSNDKQTSSYLKIRNGSMGYNYAKNYSRITLLYENDEVSQLKLISDNYINDYILKPTTGLGTYQWNLNTNKELKLDFTNGKFPMIYGIALDGTTGVAVDNFAMRGSSAVGFDKMSKSLYSKQLQALNVRAIILQYGINVVPNVRSDYGYYKTILIKQLQSIKAANPGVSIIVIGPSDMSKNKGGRMVSYSNIPLIRDAMKDAALSSGCCFWDLYEAMGGENSMSAWVSKGLAQKDYTHFSYNGAKYVGEMLYEAIMEQLNK